MKKLLITGLVVCLAAPAYATGGAPAPAPAPAAGPAPSVGPAGAGADPHVHIPKGQSGYRPKPKLPILSILKHLFN